MTTQHTPGFVSPHDSDRLIAAAPYLLTAGQHVLRVGWNGTYAEQEAALQSLRAAIAKATGAA